MSATWTWDGQQGRLGGAYLGQEGGVDWRTSAHWIQCRHASQPVSVQVKIGVPKSLL